MDTVVLMACVALTITVAGFVATPFLTSHSRASAAERNPARRRQGLFERKEQLYAAIKELEFDQATGKVADEDYERQRRGLEEDAVDVLRQLDEHNGLRSPERMVALIERDVAALRARDAPTAPAAFCTACGAPRAREHQFCSQCGARL